MSGLRWGFLGTARVNRWLVAAVRASARSTLAAVASRSLGRAEAFAATHDVPCATTYEGLLADASIDVVYVPLPNSLHVPWTLRALATAKHVLCEKPLALSTTDVDALAAAARAHGRVCAEALAYRHHPQTAAIVDVVRRGVLGDVRLLRASFRYRLDREGDVRYDAALGGGVLWDVGGYPVSFARRLLAAEPTQAFATFANGPGGVDAEVAGQLLFPEGRVLQFDCSLRAPYATALEIVGTEGVLRVARPYRATPGDRLELVRSDAAETIAVPEEMPYLGEVRDMEDAVLDGRPPAVSLADTRGTIAALVALRSAALSGAPTEVER